MLFNYSSFIGGLCGGAVSTLVCHPMDFLRTRYAANEGNIMRPQYKNYWHACRSITKAEGIRGIYQGLTPNLVASSLSWGLYFHIYHRIHDRFIDTSDPNMQSFFTNLTVGCITGTCVMSITNPLWVTKTRLCLQYENSAKRYNGMFDCLRKIYKKEGIRGFYRGFVPGLFGHLNGSIQFACYNFFKDYRCASLNLSSNNQLGTADCILFSSVSKIFSILITYPYQVIRTRLQDHNVIYAGVRDCVVRTWSREGIYGMYRGMLIALVKQTPAVVITYITYEHSKQFIETLGQ